MLRCIITSMQILISELIHVSICVSDTSCVLSGKLCTPPVDNWRVNKVLL